MNKARRRKVQYLVSMVVLFTLMIWVGRSLDTMQRRLQISQESLGRVNPVSGTAQLVLGGFRGVAVTLLWHQAQDLQKQGRFFEIEPIVKSITLLQPHFYSPWEFQSWNFAFNIAAEWEGVRDKYYWIEKGIDFMKAATETNRSKSDLEWYVGYMYFTRFGQSDEKRYLRELFRNDEDLDFVQSQSGVKDNYLVAYDWFTRANGTVLSQNIPPKRMAPHPFLCRPALSRSYYAETLADEGSFGPRIGEGWQLAYRDWVQFGLLGGKDRSKDLLFRLEYSPSEMEALTPEEKHWRYHYNRMVKYDHWKIRCQTEALPELQSAREAIFQANKARESGAYAKSLEFFEKGLPLWRGVMEKTEEYREDMLFKEDCQLMEDDYLRLLAHVGRSTPVRRPFDGLVPPLRDSLASQVQKSADEIKDLVKGQLEGAEPPKAPSPDTPAP
ncbi:hypothetical protein K2X85_09675 [bacterium]|nr:hypothetical protein [bacterium]